MSFVEEFSGFTAGSLRYVLNKKREGSIRLAMAMQVKDEVDIVEQNIRYHALKGVEGFFVMDNDSKDGTRELLESLKSEFNLTVFDDLTPDHNQSKNMTFLSHIARSKGFDWVIENDADEFWFPKSGSLLTDLNRSDTVLRVERVNVLPTKQAPKDWFYSPWLAKNTLNINLEKDFELNKNNLLLTPNLHKVLVNPHGLINVGGGNHGARHVVDKLLRRRYAGWNHNIKIFHYALRSYEQFEAKVANINKSLKYTSENNYKKHNFGAYAVCWSQMFEKGELEAVYEDMLLDLTCLPCYQNLGLIEHDDSFVTDMIALGLLDKIRAT